MVTQARSRREETSEGTKKAVGGRLTTRCSRHRPSFVCSLLSAYVPKLLGVGWLVAGEGRDANGGVFVDGGPRNRLKPARVASLLSSRGAPLLF